MTFKLKSDRLRTGIIIFSEAGSRNEIVRRAVHWGLAHQPLSCFVVLTSDLSLSFSQTTNREYFDLAS